MNNDEEKIRALTIYQPWAELILQGKKTIELRTWTDAYRGPLWLHVGVKREPDLDKWFGMENLYRGGYVGTVILESIVQMTPERWESWRDQHQDLGQYKSGFYAWLLSNPKRFAEPIPGSGQQFLFLPADEVYQALKKAKFE